MLHPEHATPRLAEHVVAIGDADVIEQHRELAHEQLHGPEVDRRVAQMLRAAGAELVVEHAGTPGPLSQRRDRLDIVVGAAGTAVQDYQRCWLVVAELADDAVPGRAGVPIDRALAHARTLSRRGLRSQQ